MSLVTFNGPEPLLTQISSSERLIAHDLPTTKQLIAHNFKRQKTDEEKKEEYKRGEDLVDEVKEGSLAIPIPNDEAIDLEEPQEEIEDDRSEQEQRDFFEEHQLLKNLISSSTQTGDMSTILKKLDALLDRKFAGLYRRVSILEKEMIKVLELLRNGCHENDTFWGFDNYRPLKNWGAVAGMADRTYAMIFDAIDFNKGVLRDNRQKKRNASGGRKY